MKTSLCNMIQTIIMILISTSTSWHKHNVRKCAHAHEQPIYIWSKCCTNDVNAFKYWKRLCCSFDYIHTMCSIVQKCTLSLDLWLVKLVFKLHNDRISILPTQINTKVLQNRGGGRGGGCLGKQTSNFKR